MDRFVRKRDLVTSELQGEYDLLVQSRLAKKARQERVQYSPAAKLQWVEKLKAAGGNYQKIRLEANCPKRCAQVFNGCLCLFSLQDYPLGLDCSSRSRAGATQAWAS